MKSVLRMAALLVVVLMLQACSKQEPPVDHASSATSTECALITFIELGSVNCIPCKQMQPVMKSIEARYAGQVKVVFHDVWKDKAPAQQYGIKLIPTQVFLDKNSKELMRHEGFFPEDDIDKFLQTQGLAPTY